MSTRNLDPVPARATDESAVQYVERLSALYYDHLDECRECNYDYECNACAADGEPDAASHSCNCDEHGWGVRMRRAIRAEKAKLS